MNQEKIMQLEEIINTKYDNITGIIGLKNGVTKYENYFLLNLEYVENGFKVIRIQKINID